MAGSESDPDAVAAAIRAAASQAGSHLVQALLSLGGDALQAVGLDVDDMTSLIQAVRPRIVYCLSVPFDAGDQVLEDLFGDKADEVFPEGPLIKKIVAKWRLRDGQSAQTAAAVVLDGVAHILLVKASWYSEYEADVEALEEETTRLILEREHERERLAEVEARKRLDPFIGKLMADPRFAGPKVGRDKRLALARELFPDKEKRVLAEVVDAAESRHWLASGR